MVLKLLYPIQLNKKNNSRWTLNRKKYNFIHIQWDFFLIIPIISKLDYVTEVLPLEYNKVEMRITAN